MNKPRFKITLFNENQYTKKEFIASPISYKTACNLYNLLTKPNSRGCFNQTPHTFKGLDCFSIKNSRIRLICFYGQKIEYLVYADGNKIDGVMGTCDLIKEV